MQAAIIAKWGIAIMGVAVMLCAFWSYAVKKMTADLSVIWEFIGAALFLVGVVPALSGWLYLLSTGSTLVLLCGMAGCLTVEDSHLLPGASQGQSQTGLWYRRYAEFARVDHDRHHPCDRPVQRIRSPCVCHRGGHLHDRDL